jgi:hypothetical protein
MDVYRVAVTLFLDVNWGQAARLNTRVCSQFLARMRLLMPPAVTALAKGDQIVELVVPQLASLSEVMHLQVLRRTAILASPAVPVEYLLTEGLVGVTVKT